MDGILKRITDLLLDLFARATPPVQIGFLLFLLGLLALLWYQLIRRGHKFEQMRIQRDYARNQERNKDLAFREEQTKLAGAMARSDALEEQVRSLTTEKGRLEQQRDTATAGAEEAADQLVRTKEELAALQKRFDGLQRIDTDVWLGPTGAHSEPPRFCPRPERRTRFVAFLNLKGGVGKTTLTANLGAAFATGVAGPPLRVLLVDLDYQGTLSSMCVRRDMREDRLNNKNTARLLLTDENQAKTSEEVLLPLMTPVEGTDGRARIIIAYEDLDDIDFRQQARFAVEQREVRFHHRKIFHDPFVLNQFDLVFFDCPPRLTTSAINALTTSDWIVVPTSLHPNDVGAVPRTLKWLDKLQAVNTFQARLAAVVLNRTYRKGTTSDLTKDEVLVHASLQREVQRFTPGGNVVIQDVAPNHPDVARYAAGSVPLGAHKEGREIYQGVAQELHKRM